MLSERSKDNMCEEMFEKLIRGVSRAKAESATAVERDVLLKVVSRSRDDCM